jgi:hypothetical protein
MSLHRSGSAAASGCPHEQPWKKGIEMRNLRFLLALLLLAIPVALSAQIRVGIAVRIAPPVIPVYEQPICPGDGYLWTPGYWAWDDAVNDYYWVPGTWVEAPEVGFLWTPGYWGWREGGYFWNEGWWGPTVGFYGGVNYGFGYFGTGFGGGRWDGGHFFYNRAVLNVNVTVIHNVYNTTIVHNDTTRVSYNGGNGGVTTRPTPEEQRAAGERHIPPVSAQTEHANTARSNPQLRASANHGNPPIAATSKAGDYSEHSVVPAKGAGEPSKEGAEGAPRTAVHPKDLPPVTHPEPANSGASKADRKYQQQQEKLATQQEQERNKLQQKQDAEHQKKLNDAQTQKLEQKHQQQTQQLSQKHAAQQQSLQARQPAPRPAPAPRK